MIIYAAILLIIVCTFLILGSLSQIFGGIQTMISILKVIVEHTRDKEDD